MSRHVSLRERVSQKLMDAHRSAHIFLLHCILHDAHTHTHTSQELRTHNGRHRTLLGHADDEGEGMSGISSVSAAGASAGSSVSGLKFKTHLVK